MNDFHTKPLNPHVLTTMLEKWLPQAPVSPSCLA